MTYVPIVIYTVSFTAVYLCLSGASWEKYIIVTVALFATAVAGRLSAP